MNTPLPRIVEILIEHDGAPPKRLRPRPRGPSILLLDPLGSLRPGPAPATPPPSAASIARSIRATLAGTPEHGVTERATLAPDDPPPAPVGPVLRRLQLRVERSGASLLLLDDRREGRRVLRLRTGAEEQELQARPGSELDREGIRTIADRIALFLDAPSAVALRGDLAVVARKRGGPESPKTLALLRAQERREAQAAELEAAERELAVADGPLRKLTALALVVALAIMALGLVVPDEWRAQIVGPASLIAIVGLSALGLKVLRDRRGEAHWEERRIKAHAALEPLDTELRELADTLARKGLDPDVVLGHGARHAVPDPVPAVLAEAAPSSATVTPLRAQARQVLIFADGPRSALDPSLADLVVEPD